MSSPPKYDSPSRYKLILDPGSRSTFCIIPPDLCSPRLSPSFLWSTPTGSSCSWLSLSMEASSPSHVIKHFLKLFLTFKHLFVLRCVGGAASRSYIDYFTDILLAMNKKYFDNLRRQLTV